jgi:hypothetical protein
MLPLESAWRRWSRTVPAVGTADWIYAWIARLLFPKEANRTVVDVESNNSRRFMSCVASSSVRVILIKPIERRRCTSCGSEVERSPDWMCNVASN